MAKAETQQKSRKSGLFDVVKDAVGIILSDRIIERISEGVDSILISAEKKAYEIEEKIIRDTMIAVLMAVGAVFLLVGLAMYIENIYPFRKGVGFLIVGGIILVCAIFARYFSIKRVK